MLTLFTRLLVCAFIILPTSVTMAGVIQVDSARCSEMRAKHVMGLRPKVPCDRLAVVSFEHLGFDERIHRGEVIVMDVLARDVEAVFRALLARRFPIASARPMETFGGSDDESMAANNTSAFNDRTIAGTSFSSLHAYGAAIDVNPVQNPYVSRTRAKISPPDGARFVSRTPPQPGMVEAIITVFATHGFTIWGGAWRDPKDYQHFQIDQRLAERLARLSKKEAFRVYDHYKKNKTR